MPAAVLKFGGSSLASESARESAVRRVRDAIANGFSPLVVCSALGRPPQPYATDTLVELAPQAKAKTRDLLLGSGELIAAAVVATLLEERGIRSEALSGGEAGIVTDRSFGNARIVRVEPERLKKLLETGVVPVVAGFQGRSEEGEMVTLGRGGSDLSAIALGTALHAGEITIYTDVDGVMTADPRRVDGAVPLAAVSHEEVIELAYHGAKVIHAKAADYAARHGTEYAIKNVHTGRGTLVSETVERATAITGLSVVHGRSFLRLNWSANGVTSERTARDVLRVLAEAEISLDLITLTPGGLYFTVARENVAAVQKALEPAWNPSVVFEDCAKLAIVGAWMRGTPGVMHRIVEVLGAAEVPVIHSTDSNITISVLIPEARSQRAEQALHDYFHLQENAPQCV